MRTKKQKIQLLAQSLKWDYLHGYITEYQALRALTRMGMYLEHAALIISM